MDTRYIGIDPGKSGFTAAMLKDGIEFYLTPTILVGKSKRAYDANEMYKILNGIFTVSNGKIIENRFLTIEKQQSMPGQGVASTFTTGFGYGLWVGIITALQIPHIIVHPRTWKKEMLRDIPGTDPKGRSIIAAQRLFPNIDFKRTPRCKGPDHNKVEALLLAEYGRRKHCSLI